MPSRNLAEFCHNDPSQSTGLNLLKNPRRALPHANEHADHAVLAVGTLQGMDDGGGGAIQWAPEDSLAVAPSDLPPSDRPLAMAYLRRAGHRCGMAVVTRRWMPSGAFW